MAARQRVARAVGLAALLVTAWAASVMAGGVERTLVAVRLADRAQLVELARTMHFDEATRGLDAAIWASRDDLATLTALGLAWREVAEDHAGRALTTCVDGDGPPFTPPASWACYPSWGQYEDLMEYWAATYPSICRLVEIGPSGTGAHRLLALKISDNPDAEEDEPEFLYTATMHGDELTGYSLTLRLADELLAGYGSDPELTALVDDLVIWVNPLANPDGTFAGGDGTVSGSQRYYVASGEDPNRSFPDPSLGDDPDPGGKPVETQAMMDLVKNESFTMAANFHGGAEVVNYPWDNWSALHADDAWFVAVSRAYATSAQVASPSGYMTDLDNGITNGYAWYPAPGCRQDFANYYYGSREVTTELSSVKQLDVGDLDDHWTWNRKAMLDFMKATRAGIRGVVADVNTGSPLAATIKVAGHDSATRRSWVYTDADAGDYHRLIAAGTWSLEVSAACFQTATVPGVVVTAGAAATRADVQLTPTSVHTVTGVVTELGSSTPVVGAVVSIVGTAVIPDTTGASGSYVLADVWGCSHTLRVEAAGFAPYQQQITVAAGSTQFDVALPASYAVSGTVRDASSGLPVAGATVALTDTGLDPTATSGSGGYAFAAVVAGAHTLAVSAAGYGAASQPITVGAGATVFDVHLAPVQVVVDETFETDNGGFTAGGSWQWGSDSVAGAVSGSKVWGTVLNANYGTDNADWSLDAPAVAIPADATSAELAFFHWYATEASYDGGQLQIAVGGGPFTLVTPVGGYPNTGIDGLDDGSGWSGTGTTWQEERVDLLPYAGSSVVLRWRFGSDGSLSNYRGWYLDDVTVTVATPPAVTALFADGFESGGLAAWTTVSP